MSERILLLHAALVVGIIRLKLWTLPFSTVRGWALRPAKSLATPPPVEQIVWAVRAVSRCIPRATCLTQAIAAQYLLKRSGHHTKVQIGVANHEGNFEAHAWLVYGERILLGGATAARYSALAAWEV